MDDLKIFAAPLQGYTEAPWRRAHSMVFGGVDRYFTPFVRVEKGAVRQRDLRDAVSPLDDGADVVAQAIFSDVDELRIIVDELSGRGVRRIDLNMGCPFPLQCRKGRGAALVERPEIVASVAWRMWSSALRCASDMTGRMPGVMCFRSSMAFGWLI